MQETGEYLEALLNEFVHDFAKNDLSFMEETIVNIPILNFTSICQTKISMAAPYNVTLSSFHTPQYAQVTGGQSSRVESLKSLLKLSIHNFSKSGLLFMKESSELLEQLLNGFKWSDLVSMQETREYLEALLNEFVYDFAKNDLLFMEETMVSVPILNFTSICQTKISMAVPYNVNLSSFHTPHYAQVAGGLKLQSRRVDSLKVLVNVFIHNLDLLLFMQETRGRLVSVLILNFSFCQTKMQYRNTLLSLPYTHHTICSGYLQTV